MLVEPVLKATGFKILNSTYLSSHRFQMTTCAPYSAVRDPSMDYGEEEELHGRAAVQAVQGGFESAPQVQRSNPPHKDPGGGFKRWFQLGA